MKHMTRKATRHISQNEGLIFEKSSPGKAAWKLPPLDVPEVDTAKMLGKQERKDLGSMPEVISVVSDKFGRRGVGSLTYAVTSRISRPLAAPGAPSDLRQSGPGV